MKIAFLIDPIAGLNPKKDSSIAMMREAARRGHSVFAFELRDLFVRAGEVRASARPLTLPGDGGRWCQEGTAHEHPLGEFDWVLMRKDPPFDSEYYYATLLLERAEAQGARVMNAARGLRDWSEKLAILRFPQFTPPTLVTREPGRIHAFVEEQRDVILKKLDGMGGTMIFRVRDDDPNRNVIVETMVGAAERTIMAQRFVPEIVDGDKRVLVIDGKPLSHCLARIPKAGETRGNLAVGGTGVARPLTARDREIAETVGAVLVQEGMLLSGLDVIGDFLTEINVTSPTCMVEIGEQAGVHAERAVIDALERRLR